ncbi:MAG: MptD family putative ECF transporter S component [[Eubacterium] brachy]|nr:MptD family putative ECF transporter S component [[Eubacterium] brachy]
MNNKLKVKDLVLIGIFAVIYFVGMFAIGMMGLIPILFLVWPFVNGAIMGILVMVFMAKEQKPWTLFIFGILAPLIMFIMGHSYVVLVNSVIVMLLAELTRRKGGYKSFKHNAIANGFFSMWAAGALMQMLLVKEAYMEITVKMMNQEYANALEKLITYPNMVIVYISAFIGGILGAYLGKKVLKKHFEKAGMI